MKTNFLVFVLGSTLMGKTTLVASVCKELKRDPYVFFHDARTREIYRSFVGPSFCRDTSILKNFDRWKDEHNGSCVCIEDIAPNLDKNRAVILSALESLLTALRFDCFLVSQKMIGLDRVVSDVRLFVLFNTRNRTNFAIAFGGDFKKIAVVADDLNDREFVLVDTVNKVYSGIQNNDETGAKFVASAIVNGFNGKSYSVKKVDRTRKSNHYDEDEFVQYVLRNYKKTYSEMSKELGVGYDAVQQRVWKATNRGKLPNEDKRLWTDAFLWHWESRRRKEQGLWENDRERVIGGDDVKTQECGPEA